VSVQSSPATAPRRVLALDAADPHAHRRSAFQLDDDVVYMDGNSLGPLPLGARARIRQVVDNEWGCDLIRSWNTNDWINLPRRVGDRIGELIGAAPGQVVAGDSTSVCLFKLAAAAVQAQRGRSRLVTDTTNFPTDLYGLDGLARLDPSIEVVRVPPEAVLDAVDRETSLLVLSHIDYRSGAMRDLRTVTAAAHACGALTLWDLSHSVGAVPVALDADGADLAVGCTYKYLNGGPGAPAFAYVAARLHESMPPALRGWMGHRAPFALDEAFSPAAGARRYSCGTPEVLGLSVLDAALDVFTGVDMGTLRDKTARMSELFIELVEEHGHEHGLALVSPRNPAQRGSHVALEHPHAYPIMQALIARGVIGDFRAPNLMRFGFAPLYQSYADVWRAAQSLRDVLMSRAWDDESFKRIAFVT
jgi:kynureninase